MKTQIIRRIVLAVISLIICYSNNTYNAQITIHHSLTVGLFTKNITLGFTISVNTKNLSKPSACITCKLCSHEEAIPVPEPNSDHEFHSFHVKDKHEKHASFWKNIANKIVAAIYYVVVLVAYLPYKYLS